MPASLDFVLLDKNDNPLLTNSTNLKMWYTANGQEQIINDLQIKNAISSNSYSYYATTVFAPLQSSDNISKHFYLQFESATKLDTIYLDVQRLSQQS